MLIFLELCSFYGRYSGYCAWRGVLNFSDNENSETILGLKKAYPDLGRCLYFDLGSAGHSVFYELLNKRINWIWYINQPEPEVKVCSFYQFYPLIICHEFNTISQNLFFLIDSRV